MRDRALQLRDENPRTGVGEPDEGGVEAEHERKELAPSHVDVGDEELLADLEQEERPVTFLTELVAVIDAELDDLTLRHDELVEIAQRAEHLGEPGIFAHLVHHDRLCLRRTGGLVCLPVLEVAVEVAGENLLGSGHRFRSVRLRNHDFLAHVERDEDGARKRARSGNRLRLRNNWQLGGVGYERGAKRCAQTILVVDPGLRGRFVHVGKPPNDGGDELAKLRSAEHDLVSF